MRRRAISQVLVIAALLSAMGTDVLAQAGLEVRAQAVVNVAERVAFKFNHAFARRVHQPAAARFQESRPAALVVASAPAAYDTSPLVSLLPSNHLLNLPPPALA